MTSSIPYLELNRPKPDISVQKSKDGSYLITNNISIGEYEKNIANYWLKSAEEVPDRACLVKCSPDEDWPQLTFKEAADKADQISTWLLNNGYNAETPVLILSGNSFAHALLTMAALQIGVPIAPLSPSYSLMSADFERLRYASELVGANLVFAEDGDLYGKALNVLGEFDLQTVTVSGDTHGGIRFEDMLGICESDRVRAARAKVQPASLAKILFTSGSTGMPKAVPNTQEMLCSAQKMVELMSEPRDPEGNPTIFLDWLPWHHTFGANANFLGCLRLGGTMYLDDGKPVPGLFQRTIENIKRIKPTRFSSVPTAYSFLLDQMEQDEELGRAFFERMRLCNYGGAALSQELFERLQVQAVKYTGKRIPVGTGWGATETTAMGTAVFWNEDQVGLVGVPYSGITLKLVPVQDKFEVRLKGPAVHSGYYKRPDLTKDYFDEDGFYCIGDAVQFIDPQQPERGLAFKGRVSEDFKLSNGTWVETGSLRLTLIDALDPFARDVVIAGHDKEFLSILIVPSEFVVKDAIKRGFVDKGPLSIITDSELMAKISEKITAHNTKFPSKSRFVGSALIMGSPLSADKNEITDKQYINQRAVLDNRAELVSRLYNDQFEDIMKFN
ncbi:AMP-binding protein [Sneathiella glossodoripedis]|uniref:AMP-binding protein n=1 Tax=Sneathiella glossodoripedis TaxID=418853 RepID=UPI00056D3536|nr:AMP-binding protein [Sneathiella glossodoripedis]